MPTYVYKFVETGETIEVQQAFTDDALTEAVHPATGDDDAGEEGVPARRRHVQGRRLLQDRQPRWLRQERHHPGGDLRQRLVAAPQSERRAVGPSSSTAPAERRRRALRPVGTGGTARQLTRTPATRLAPRTTGSRRYGAPSATSPARPASTREVACGCCPACVWRSPAAPGCTGARRRLADRPGLVAGVVAARSSSASHDAWGATARCGCRRPTPPPASTVDRDAPRVPDGDGAEWRGRRRSRARAVAARQVAAGEVLVGADVVG